MPETELRELARVARATQARPLGDIPSGVISRKIPIELPPGLPAGLTTAVSERVWRASQRRLALLAPQARRRIATRSSHYIMFSQPGLIIREVRRVVRRVSAPEVRSLSRRFTRRLRSG